MITGLFYSDTGQFFAVSPGRYFVGNSPNASWKLTSADIQAKHARLVVDDDGSVMLDRGAANALIQVNRRDVQIAQALHHRDEVTLGAESWLFFDVRVREERDAYHITYSYANIEQAIAVLLAMPDIEHVLAFVQQAPELLATLTKPA